MTDDETPAVDERSGFNDVTALTVCCDLLMTAFLVIECTSVRKLSTGIIYSCLHYAAKRKTRVVVRTLRQKWTQQLEL